MDAFPVRIGLAMSGGGAKVNAHIGVLRVFEKYGIKISSIVGSSLGAFVASCVALGYPVDNLVRENSKLVNNKFFRLGNINFFGESILKSRDLDNRIRSLVGDNTFADTKIPFKVIAVDLEAGHESVIEDGKLYDAIKASSSYPGIMPPYFYRDKCFVDGGLLNNVPVDYLRKQKDLDIIIGVQLGVLTTKQHISGLIWENYYNKPKSFRLSKSLFHKLKVKLSLFHAVIERSIDILREEAQLRRYDEAKADIMIQPDVSNIALLQFDKIDEAIAAGEKAADAMMGPLLNLIEEKRKEKYKRVSS